MIQLPIEAVTFDAAGTLLSPYPSVGAVYAEIMRDYGLVLNPDEVETAFVRAFKKVQGAPRDHLSEDSEMEWWRKIVRETLVGHPPPRDFEGLFQTLWDTFSEARRWRLPTDAISTIETLKQRGYGVAVLSNWDKRLRLILQQLDIQETFDHIFISSEIGVEKPDPRIFEHAQQRLGVDASQVLHIGDSRKHDFEGARQVGWQALLIQHKPDGPVDGHHIRRFSELLALLPDRGQTILQT